MLRIIPESEAPKGLVKEIKKYFHENIHKITNVPFRLARLERYTNIPRYIFAVPEDMIGNIGIDDLGWEKGLDEIGKRYKFHLKLPWYVHPKC